MSEVLRGKALLWSSWDATGLTTAALGKILVGHYTRDSVRVRWLRASGPEQLSQLAAAQKLGLALWCLKSEAELPAICRAIAVTRGRGRGPICLACLESAHLDAWPILAEAGAHLVVYDLPGLQKALPKMLTVAPLSPHGYHPLTAGLIERLPWSGA